MGHRIDCSRWATIGVLGLLCATCAAAQSPTGGGPAIAGAAEIERPSGPAASPDGTNDSAPRSIPVSQIARRATADEAILSLTRSNLGSDSKPSLSDIESGMPAVVADVSRLAGLPASREPEGRKLAELLRVGADWRVDQSRLAAWDAALVGRAETLENAGQRLEGMRRDWSATRETARRQEVPAVVTERIDSILREIDVIDALRRERLAALLILQDRVSREQSTVNDAVSRIAIAEQRARSRRFGLEGEPLWVAVPAMASEPSLSSQVREDWRQRVADLRDFVNRHPRGLALHAGVFLGFLALLLVLRGSAGRHPTLAAELGPTRGVLAAPVSAALLFALVATRMIYGVPPFVVIDVVVLAGLVPFLRLMPGLVGASSRLALYAFVGLLVADRLSGLADERTALYRLALLGLSGLSLALAVRVLRSGKLASADAGPWWHLSRALVRLASVVLIVSLIANVVGSPSLARLLTRTTLLGTYVALVLFGAALAIEAVVVVTLRSEVSRSLRLVNVYAEASRKWIVGSVRLLLFLAWLRITLTALDAYRPLAEMVRAALTRQWMIGSLAFSAGAVLAFVAALTLGLLASRFIPALVQQDVLSRTKLPLGTRGTIALLLRYGILVLAFLAAVAVAGLRFGEFAIVVGALGVGIGFGLQELVNNFVSGLILAFERPIRMGDTLQIGDLLGNVVRIGLRASVVRTLDGAEVIVPNGQLLSGTVTNWTLSDRRRRVEISASVAYGTELHRVLELLEGVARASPHVLRAPEPQALFKGFGDSSLDFILRCWIADYDDGMTVRSAVSVAIHDALREAGIEIPFPQRDLHVRSVDARAAESLRASRAPGIKAE